jgi:hypothetical protein
MTLDSSPMSVYLHTNKKQYLNESLLYEHQEEIQDSVMRVFLESLYGTLGFIPHYLQEKEESKLPPVFTPSGTAERLWLITVLASDIGIDPGRLITSSENKADTISCTNYAINIISRLPPPTLNVERNVILPCLVGTRFWRSRNSHPVYLHCGLRKEEETRVLTDKGVTEYERVDLGVCRILNLMLRWRRIRGPRIIAWNGLFSTSIWRMGWGRTIPE